MVADDEGVVIGFFIVAIVPYFFSLQTHAADLAFYVAKEYRGSSAAMRLLRAAETWAIRLGVKECRFGAATGINPDVADKFFTGMGYDRGGVLYVKRTG